MLCNNKESCERNLVATANSMENYGCVYICEVCKKYYIKANEQIFEVEFDDGNWRFAKGKYVVKCSGNGGNDSLTEYGTEDEAERSIEDGLNFCKEFSKDSDYDYADYGNRTEFWVYGEDDYICWDRLWK